MRISKEQTQANRGQILEKAAMLFRKHGFDGIGVADIMKAAGFTVGGFYNHFASKEELSAEATKLAFQKLDAETSGLESVEQILKRYISENHRDELETACPAAILGSEAAHQPALVKSAFKDGIERWLDRLEEALEKKGHTKPKARRELAVSLLAKAVGAVVLARASSTNSALSDEIIETSLRSTLLEAKLK